MTARPLAISVESASKDFRLAAEQRHTLKERVINPRFDRGAKQFHALREVSFDVARGEFFGIVGRNGSGKSTLLKCMAGIYRLDGGSISIGGRLSTFIELGVGFNPDLAARDNIILNGIMLGLTPQQAAERVDPVIEFAELQDHVDLKLKNYSSGMQVRLAFSVLTQVDADVLLIDEVLAVGDAAFQAKCFDVFRELRAAGKTIVLVTHDMATVARFCDRALLLEDGEVVAVGDPQDIGDAYLNVNFARNLPNWTSGAPGPVFDVQGLTQDASHAPTLSVSSGEDVRFIVDITALQPSRVPNVTLELVDEHDTVAFGATTATPVSTRDDRTLQVDDRWRVDVRTTALLRPGHYRLRAVLRDPDTGQVVQRTGAVTQVDITATTPAIGLAALPHTVAFAPQVPVARDA